MFHHRIVFKQRNLKVRSLDFSFTTVPTEKDSRSSLPTQGVVRETEHLQVDETHRGVTKGKTYRDTGLQDKNILVISITYTLCEINSMKLD